MISYETLTQHPLVFHRLLGVSIARFDQKIEQILPLWARRRDNYEQGGRSHAIKDINNQLMALLLYYRCDISYAFLGELFGVHETTVLRTIKRLESSVLPMLAIDKPRKLSLKEVKRLIAKTTSDNEIRTIPQFKRYFTDTHQNQADNKMAVPPIIQRSGKIYQLPKNPPPR